MLYVQKYNLHAVLKRDLPFFPTPEALETRGIILLAANDETNPYELHSQQKKARTLCDDASRACGQREAEANI